MSSPASGPRVQLATLCYVRHAGHTLMLHRVKKQRDIHQGKWNGLGGKLESGETPEQCVIREIAEESGLTIREPRLAGFITFPKFKDEVDWYVFVFEATDYSGELITSDEGNLAWIPDDQLLQLHLWEGDPIFLRWLLDKRFFSACFCYEQGRLASHHATFY
jgi:8-oxo-dGTP diphosphatase